MRCYLGTHQTSWLARLNAANVPLFVSHRRLVGRVSRHERATQSWALDSGGFSELSLFGRWTISPEEYVASVRRYQSEIGMMDWAAIQDWMCEPFILDKTGLTVAEHQRRSVQSYLDLCDLAPEIPWVPVLQGWAPNDYLRHRAMYADAGVDLAALSTVGLGSVCRRQHTDEVGPIIQHFFDAGVKLHGFGFKVKGLEKYGHLFKSADSMAWSFQARRSPPHS